MLDHALLVQTALENGAKKAVVIPREKIVTNKAFWEICAGNGCGRFGRYWVCPPAIGEPDALEARLNTFTHAVLYQTIGEIEDSFDIEGMGEVGVEHKKVSRKIDAAVKPLLKKARHLHLSSGGCDLCEKCTKPENKPCRFPELALAAMEGYCIDVYRTAKGTKLKYTNGENTVTYFGIVLFAEEENG